MNKTISTLACVFPGQGSQSIGMLKDFSGNTNLKQVFQEASDVLSIDLWKIIQEGPESELNQTQITQPAMLAAGVSVWKIWCESGGALPSVMAGHSLGEYTALVCSGSLKLANGIKLVNQRGNLMQKAVPEGVGSMAAILGMTDEEVILLCNDTAEDEVLSPVNFNSPGQIVIAGNTKAVDRAMEIAKDRGAKRALKLQVSVPSHCALMKPAADEFAKLLDEIEFSEAAIPVIHNVDVKSYNDAGSIREALSAQMYQPVRWTEIIQKMRDSAVDKIIEAGPGKVLVGLNKRIDKSIQSFGIVDQDSLDKALEAMGEINV